MLTYGNMGQLHTPDFLTKYGLFPFRISNLVVLASDHWQLYCETLAYLAASYIHWIMICLVETIVFVFRICILFSLRPFLLKCFIYDFCWTGSNSITVEPHLYEFQGTWNFLHIKMGFRTNGVFGKENYWWHGMTCKIFMLDYSYK